MILERNCIRSPYACSLVQCHSFLAKTFLQRHVKANDDLKKPWSYLVSFHHLKILTAVINSLKMYSRKFFRFENRTQEIVREDNMQMNQVSL